MMEDGLGWWAWRTVERRVDETGLGEGGEVKILFSLWMAL